MQLTIVMRDFLVEIQKGHGEKPKHVLFGPKCHDFRLGTSTIKQTKTIDVICNHPKMYLDPKHCSILTSNLNSAFAPEIKRLVGIQSRNELQAKHFNSTNN